MRKWLQKAASVLLAAMMVQAAMPVWGVAETVTTPSDLPGVTDGPTEEPTEEPAEEPTEVPTEIPTEEPAEVPTEEPVEEVPPVVMEEMEQPPMLMAANEDVTQWFSGAGQTEVTDTQITLISGRFTMGDDPLRDIVVSEEAKLTINWEHSILSDITVKGDLNNDTSGTIFRRSIVITGGTARIRGEVKANVSVSGGKLELRDGKISALNAQNQSNITIMNGEVGELTANGSTVTIAESSTVYQNASLTDCTLTTRDCIIAPITLTRTTCTIEATSEIRTVKIAELPSGKMSIACHLNTKLSLPRWIEEDMVKYFAPKALGELKAGQSAPSGAYPKDTGNFSYISSQLSITNLWHQNCMIEYKPKDSKLPMSSDAEYQVIFHTLDEDDTKHNLTVFLPVISMTKIHLAGGTITKTYDGNGNFSGMVENPVWQTENGNPYAAALACTVEGTGCTNYQAGGYQNVACTKVTVSGTLPSDVTVDTANCHVNVMVEKRPLTLIVNNETIMQGDAMPTFSFTSNTGTGMNVGLAGNDLVKAAYVVKDSADQVVDDMTTASPGQYTIEIANVMAYAYDGKNEVDRTNNYTITRETGTLTVTPAAYTVTIPAAVELANGTGSMTLDCKIKGRTTVAVTAASANDWVLKDGDLSIPYTLTPEASTTRAAMGDALATFTESGTADLVFATIGDTNPAAGTYTDTLTFTVSAAN